MLAINNIILIICVVCLVCPMLQVSLDYPPLITSIVFSHGYIQL
jgi:hypothetical protein